MARLVIAFGALILFIVLAWLSHRRPRVAEPAHPAGEDVSSAAADLALRTPITRRAHLRASGQPLRLISMLLRVSAPCAGWEMLHQHGRELTLLLLALRRDLRSCPALPAGAQQAPRMLLLGRMLACHGAPCDAAALNEAIVAWDETSATTHEERMLLPLCTRVALSEQLQETLQALHHDLQDAQRGQQLARRILRSRRPVRLLQRTLLTPACSQALLSCLRQTQHAEFLSGVEEYLAQRGLSSAEIAQKHNRTQALYAEEILRCLQDLRRLSTMEWTQVEEDSDPLHLLFLDDPAGVYPLMTPESRLKYRAEAARLCRLFHTDEARLCRTMLHLARHAEPDGTQNHIGWYLLEPAGVRALHRRLKARSGALRLWLQRHTLAVSRAALIILNTTAAFLLLHTGCSLWLLPPLLLLTGFGFRQLSGLIPYQQPFVPQLALDSVPGDMRTLVVLPALLRSKNEVLPAVRRLLMASHAMPEGAVDYLLLADYSDSLTASSGEDSGTLHAARCAMEAIDQPDRRFLYLHRTRIYDKRLHRYAGREGRLGAMDSLRQMITDGTCPDDFDAQTVSPPFFHRRYAYVLMLPESASPAPDMLLPLLGAMAHPLNNHAAMAFPHVQPDPTSLRSRISACWQGAAPPCTCCLLDPYLLSDPQGLAEPARMPEWILSGLTSTISVPESKVYHAQPASLSAWLQRLHRHAGRRWMQLSWLMPWLTVQGQVQHNPLSAAGRKSLRRALANALLPLAQLIVLFFAGLTGSLPMFLLALLPDLPALLPLGPKGVWHFLSRFALLPLRAVISADALWRGLWIRLLSREPRLPSPAQASTLAAMETWSQVSGALLAVLTALLPLPPFWPGLLAAALFACFPLLHTWLDAPLRRPTQPTAEMHTALLDFAHATWRYFEDTVSDATRNLPPERVQLHPYRGTAASMSIADAGLYLLACICAYQLEMISADAMASRISAALDTLDALPCWHGLPYARYSLPPLTPVDDRIVSADCGILCACLLCTAQALRAALPDLPQAQHPLPARLDSFADKMQLHMLYDPLAGLFLEYVHADTEEPAATHHLLCTSVSLLTSFIAVMRREVPQEHLTHLLAAKVGVGPFAAPIAPHGSAADYLLTLLMLPAPPASSLRRGAQAFIRQQRRQGYKGMFGASDCAVWHFDAQMNYLLQPQGLPQLAMEDLPAPEVITPYAAALCLPHQLSAAMDSLTRLRSYGALGPMGFYDSLDYAAARLPQGQAETVIQCHLSGHQAIILCAVCHVLTGGSLTRTFIKIPAAASFAPLLDQLYAHPLQLPARAVVHKHTVQPEPAFCRVAQHDSLPLDAHLIGTPEASVLLSAHGTGVLRAGGRNLTRFTGSAALVEGLQFYLNDGTQILRLGTPGQMGETVFSEGCIRLSRTLPGLNCTLTALVDPASGTLIHTLELLNLSGNERFLEIADCMQPDFSVPGEYHTTAAQPADRAVTLTHRTGIPGDMPMTLCHVLTTADPLITLSAVSEMAGGSLLQPEFLFAADEQSFAPWPRVPCAGFRMHISLGARGKATLIFTTRILEETESFSLERLTPRTTDLPGLTTLSQLCCRGIARALQASQAQMRTFSRAAGVLLWHDQPHQGAVSPLIHPRSALKEAGLDPALPLATVQLFSKEGIPLLQEALLAVAWMHFSGHSASLCVLCSGDEADTALLAAQAAFAASPLPAQLHHALLTASLPQGLRETIEAASALLLYEGAGSLETQLDALLQPMPQCIYCPVEAAALPPEKLRFATAYGGFQEQTDDYVLRLEPRQTPPVSWTCMLCDGEFTTLACPDGPGQTSFGALPLTFPLPNAQGCAELCCLWEHDGFLLPFSSDFARRIQHSPGLTSWHSEGNNLDLTLTAAMLPGENCALRTLRIRNQQSRPRNLSLILAVHFGDLSCLTVFPSGVVVSRPDMPQPVRLMFPENACTLRRTTPAALSALSFPPCGLDAPDEEVGSLALLTVQLTLAGSGSQAISWVLGIPDTADAAEQLLHRLRTGGTSPLYRAVRGLWAQQLYALTISTPDEALNLLLNRLLSWQIRLPHAGGQHRMPEQLARACALSITQPELSRALLVQCAAHQFAEGDVHAHWHSPAEGSRCRLTGDRLLLCVAVARYVSVTGDASLLQATAPFLDVPGNESIHMHCMRALTSIRLGAHGLPLMGSGEMDAGLALHSESMLLAGIFALALERYAAIAPEDDRQDILEVHRHLTAAMDRHGWDGSWYVRAWTTAGLPIGSAQTSACQLDALTQAVAALALPPGERPRQAVTAAWRTLFAPQSGLACMTPPWPPEAFLGSSTAMAPGYGSNGGVDLLTACWMLAALCHLGMTDHAWAMLNTLTPLHRDVDAVPPWVLPGAMNLHGEALHPDKSGASGMLYLLTLECLLGLRRRGDRLYLSPHVPAAWEGFSITLNHGASTWHMHFSRDFTALTCDGDEVPEDWILLRDDGRIHQIRAPLNHSI